MGKFDWQPDNIAFDPKPKKKANAKPRTLYIRRDVLNYKDIEKWAKSQGFKKTTGSTMHVTIAYHKSPVDWMKLPSLYGMAGDGKLEIQKGGARLVEPLGTEGAVCLLFTDSTLKWRHKDLHTDGGLSWSFPEYQPHITITWDAGDLDLSTVEPYQGKIVLGPEIFAEVKETWRSRLVENKLGKVIFRQLKAKSE